MKGLSIVMLALMGLMIAIVAAISGQSLCFSFRLYALAVDDDISIIKVLIDKY